MAKNFAFKDARQQINVIKTLIKQLTQSEEYQNSKKKEITRLFNMLNSSKFFSNAANKEILGQKASLNNYYYDDLILSLFKYLISDDIVQHAKVLKNQIKTDTSDDIAALSVASNPITWLFASGNKKNTASKSFERLLSYSNSFLIEDANHTINTIGSFSNLTQDEANGHYANNRSDYEKAIKEIIVSADELPKVKAINEVLSQYNSICSSADNTRNKYTIDVDKAKKAIEKLIAFELLKILRGVPIEEINRDKKGIRVKPLREAGYTNMAEVFVADVYNLAAVYGISHDNAHTIKRIADGYARQARKGIKIKLTYDDKNMASNEVVKTLYALRQEKSYIKQIDDVQNKYSGLINKAIGLLNEIGSGRFWTFYGDAYKKHAKESYDQLKAVLNGEYSQIIKTAAKDYQKLIIDESLDNAWVDFRDNSIEFYNLVEEIYPGVLGFDDTLFGLPEDLAKEIQEESFFPEGLLCTLRRYQELGVKYILHQERVLLGDEMGLGKTIQAIATMVSLKNTGATHFVVVCPKSVITNWCREIAKHSRLKVMKAHGYYKTAVIKSWIKNGGVVVTTYESTSAFDLDPSFKFSQLVVDEAHYIKNRGAARTSRTIELSKHADRVLFMTGTALENRVDEMISLIDVLQPKIAERITNIAFMSTAPQFRETIAPVYFRRKREDVLTELPDKIESEEWCTLTEEEERTYEDAVLSKSYMTARRVSWNIDNINNSSKMARLKEIIEDAKNDDRKILVFSFFLDTIAKITQTLGPNICLNPINGSVNPNRRQEIIDEFENAPSGTVLCAQIQSGGTGLNIQAASVVIICEPQLKPSIENQAISRAYRMGQSRKVQVFRLLCENSIDEKILNILKEKQAIFDAFADKSVAAQKVEIDDKTLGDIIIEEIDRINKKRGIQVNNTPEANGGCDIQNKDKRRSTSALSEAKTVNKWEKARDVYHGLPKSVTSRIQEVSQPFGGYIRPKDMDVESLPIYTQLCENENVSPNLIGLAVDYLTRFMIEKDATQAFYISLLGALNLNATTKAKKLIAAVNGLDDTSIVAAIKLTGFDVAYRATPAAYKPIEDINPDSYTISNVRIMVGRALDFFDRYGPVTKFGYTFEDCYTKVIGTGDGDFMTSDTLWDFKVSKNEPQNKHTFQLLVYYIMGLHSSHPEYRNIKQLGIYNPRSNKVYRYPVDKIGDEVIKRIEEEVIGY